MLKCRSMQNNPRSFCVFITRYVKCQVFAIAGEKKRRVDASYKMLKEKALHLGFGAAETPTSWLNRTEFAI